MAGESNHMSLMHNDKLTVRVGDLVSGFFWGGMTGNRETSQSYFPKLNWDVWAATYRMMQERPTASPIDWPLYPVWREMVHHRFRGTKNPECVTGWDWATWSKVWRRTVDSFTQHGYDPGRIIESEKYTVSIERDGSLCVGQGNKRVALLRITEGLDFEIKVRVVQRHPEWVALKKGLYDVPGKMDLYQPLDHPDFAGWSITQPCAERWKMIHEWLGPAWFEAKQPRNVLDIGCHTGWFCRKFAAQGCKVMGIDSKPTALRAAFVASVFRHDDGNAPRYIKGDCSAIYGDYDVCLCLSLIMHLFAQTEHDEAWRQLAAISKRCRVMFLDCVWGGYTKHLPFTPVGLPAAFMKHTTYTHFHLLGRTAHENRPFYVFWRD